MTGSGKINTFCVTASIERRILNLLKFGEVLTDNADDNTKPSFIVYKEGLETAREDT